VSDKITKNMTISEAINKNPNAAHLLFKYGFHCAGCAFAAMETIEQGCKAHGMNDEQIEKLIEELNNQK
jgi:hybrid cluster-associated redox disulfide protein